MGNVNQQQNPNANAILHNHALFNINDGNAQNLIPIEEQNQIIQERSTKKVMAVRLPCYLKKETLSLEKDAISQEKNYIKFNYDSLVELDCYIYFNVSEKPQNQLVNNEINGHKLAYCPSQYFSEKVICVKKMKDGENANFFNENAYIDLNDYFLNKVANEHSYDLCIEFVPIFAEGSPELAGGNEIVMVTLCNFEKHKTDDSYEIKCVLQRLRTHDIWIDFNDIFDSGMEGGLCLICCSAMRNTIFLPCNHAACCDKCGSEIKLRFRPCPICKTEINDLLIIDTDEKNIGDDEIDLEENEKSDDEDKILIPKNKSNIIDNGNNNNIDADDDNDNIIKLNVNNDFINNDN